MGMFLMSKIFDFTKYYFLLLSSLPELDVAISVLVLAIVTSTMECRQSIALVESLSNHNRQAWTNVRMLALGTQVSSAAGRGNGVSTLSPIAKQLQPLQLQAPLPALLRRTSSTMEVAMT